MFSTSCRSCLSYSSIVMLPVLTCYMLFSTLFNIAQTVVTKKFVFDEEKILAELNIQKAKPKKKNSFQARLEEAMKRQQEMQRQKDTKPKKKRK